MAAPHPADSAEDERQLVVLRGVRKSFGKSDVLQGIDLRLHEHEVICLIGASGSGKSTLLRCIDLLEPIDAGRIVLDGRDITAGAVDRNRVRRRMGIVFQAFNLFPHMTVLQNVTLGPIKVRGIPKAEATQRGMALLERVGIGSKADQYPAQLSGGQQQRAAIARALAMEPKLMLFDEPTSALDPEMIKEVLDVMIELAKEGTTMIVVTHEMGFARSAARRVVFMDGGRIVETAEPGSFFSSPSTDRAREFLSKILAH